MPPARSANVKKTIATAIAAIILIQRRDMAYTGVILWALVAIALKHWNNPILRNAALILAIVLVLTATIFLLFGSD